MQVRILDKKDAEAFWNLRLRALQENPESFGASYEEILERGIAGTAQGLSRREEETKKRHKGLIWGMYVPRELQARDRQGAIGGGCGVCEIAGGPGEDQPCRGVDQYRGSPAICGPWLPVIRDRAKGAQVARS